LPRSLLSIASLLLGSAFLFFAGGLTGVLLPVRGGIEGFSSFWLGLLGTGWAVGYVSGCLYVPRIVTRSGHIRAYSVMAACACISILLTSMLMVPIAWVVLRALAGFAFAGAAMIVESWLTERSSSSVRGVIFGTYTMVNLFATTVGQMVIAVVPAEGVHLFTISAIFYVVALLPTALTRSPAPAPLARVTLDVAKLWRNSPIAVVAVFLTGVSNGTFGTLAAVYGRDIGLDLAGIALFVSASILAGAAAQIPVGYISDKMDRRYVVIGIAIVAIISDGFFLNNAPKDTWSAVIHAAVFGAAIFTFYPVLVAHANDHAAPEDSLQTSGGLLLMIGVGSIVGPLIAGALMSAWNEQGLFIVTLVSHTLILLYAIWRLTQRKAAPGNEKSRFIPIAPMRTRTPQTILMADQLAEPEADDGGEKATSARQP